MLKSIFLLFVLFSTVLCFGIKQHFKKNYCYATDKNSYKYLATKTAYEFVHGNKDKKNKHLTHECKPVQFWSLNRHGTRLPGKKAIKELEKLTEIQTQIIENYKNEVPNTKINGLCEQDLALFKSWIWNSSITEDIATTLTTQGWLDLKELAQRNERKYPELLKIDYSEKDYLFRYTRHERTESSFKAYAEGLFGTYNNVHGISFENDTLIETYKNCKLWEETVDDNPETYEEYNKFTNTNQFQQMISDVSDRLGFKNTLDLDLINSFYDMCRYEQAWYPSRKSTWCAAFTKEHLQLLEYAEDLMYYYSTGHGIDMNKKVGCMPLQDLMARFENVINGDESEPKSIHYFTHSSSVQLLMASMGMKKDKMNLTAENYNEQQGRLWRTSLVGPFATNIYAVLYKCTAGDEYRVTFHLNENKYEFPGCPRGVCSWKSMKEMFSEAAENCNLDFCKNNNK